METYEIITQLIAIKDKLREAMPSKKDRTVFGNGQCAGLNIALGLIDKLLSQHESPSPKNDSDTAAIEICVLGGGKTYRLALPKNTLFVAIKAGDNEIQVDAKTVDGIPCLDVTSDVRLVVQPAAANHVLIFDYDQAAASIRAKRV